MTVDQTIDAAVLKFGVRREDILAGRKCRNIYVVAAREWIIEQHPLMSANALSKAMHYRDHVTILLARKRIADRAVSKNNNIDFPK